MALSFDVDQSGERDVHVEEQSEEGEAIRCRRTHSAPTKAERARHNLTHIPFRNWCRHCVVARGVSTQHRTRRKDEEREVAEVVLDYCFMRDLEGEEAVPVLVIKDRWSKLLSVHVVPSKGAGCEWVVQQVKRDLQRMGHHGRLILKSDQEAAIVDLLNEVTRARGDVPTVVENSAVGDSQGNGFIERGVRSVEEMVRTLKFDLEERLGESLSVHHPVFAWILEHVVDLINKVLIGSDGKTAHQRLKGKRYLGELYVFGTPHYVPCFRQSSGWTYERKMARGYMAWQAFQHKRELSHEDGGRGSCTREVGSGDAS